MSESGIEISGCIERYDAQLEACIDCLAARLGDAHTEAVRNACSEGAEAAAAKFNAFVHGQDSRASGAPVGNGHAGSRLVATAGAEDDEHPLHEGGPLRLRTASRGSMTASTWTG